MEPDFGLINRIRPASKLVRDTGIESIDARTRVTQHSLQPVRGDSEIALAMAAPVEAPETRLHALFAVLGTDLGTEPSELDANKRDVMKQAGRLNAFDLDI